jgi:hypothetical protein
LRTGPVFAKSRHHPLEAAAKRVRPGYMPC